MFFSENVCDLGSCMDLDILTFADQLQHIGGSFIQLSSHKERRSFQHSYVAFGFLHLPGCFQSQDAAADDHHIPDLRKHGFDLPDIFQTADSDNLFLILSINRRDKALGSQSIDQLCISQLHALFQKHFFIFRVNACHLFSQKKMDIIFLIPLFFFNSDLFFI